MFFSEISCLWWKVLLRTYNVILSKEKSHTNVSITNLKSYLKNFCNFEGIYFFQYSIQYTISTIGINCSKRLFLKKY